MSGIALVAAALGAEVTGSDRAESTVRRPPARGRHRPGDRPRRPQRPRRRRRRARVLDRGRPENPERALARERGLPSCTAPMLLAEITALRPTIAVAGTHGKTTTTAMIVHALRGAGADPGYLVGGELRSTGSNAGWGAGEWTVVEADESDRSMLKLAARGRGGDQRRARPPRDLRLAGRPRGRVREFLALAAARASCGTGPTCSRWRCAGDAEVVPSTSPRPSCAPAARASTGAATTSRSPCPAPTTRSTPPRRSRPAALAGRRPRPRRRRAGRLPRRRPALRAPRRAPRPAPSVYDDYAHHPTEVAATIAAARTLGPRRVVAVFQPHLYSRTAALRREFGAALAARRRRRRPRRLPRPRARRGLPRGHRPPGRRGGRRRAGRARPSSGCPTSTTPSACCAACLRAGDLVPGHGRRRRRRARATRSSPRARPPPGEFLADALHRVSRRRPPKSAPRGRAGGAASNSRPRRRRALTRRRPRPRRRPPPCHRARACRRRCVLALARAGCTSSGCATRRWSASSEVRVDRR